MAVFVADASATLPWCLKDEETAWTIKLLRSLDEGEQIVVPAHWPIEMSNALVMATRRGRIPQGRAQLFWDELELLPITVEPPLSAQQSKAVIDLAQRFTLTVYDAGYLHLALSMNTPLATLDRALINAARFVGIKSVN